MDLRELVGALLRHDDLTARQWVKSARHAGLLFSTVPFPEGLDQDALALAAGIVEVLAERAGEAPPSWSAQVGEASQELWLSTEAQRIPVLRERCRRFGPEPLRRRRVVALPDVLKVA